MAYKSKLLRCIIKFLAIPVLVMPSSVILASIGDQNQQNIPRSSELAKEYYIKQQSLGSKKNQDEIKASGRKVKDNITLEGRRCLMIKQQISKQNLRFGDNSPTDSFHRTKTQNMLYENHNCEQVLRAQSEGRSAELDALNPSNLKKNNP